ncbi:MAG: hypothetical protein J2P25_00655 [Nocardiopsaceae bacterium]|nr:hypothetical protein [Nocardiopsaceae bacterium]
MTFNGAQFEALIEKILHDLDALANDLASLVKAVASAVEQWFIPESVQHAVVSLAEGAAHLLEGFVDMVKHVLEGALAPLELFRIAQVWEGANVREIASTVAGDTMSYRMIAQLAWNSTAATKYRYAIYQQSPAAAQVASIADKTASSLNVCAVAGLVFYAAVAHLVITNWWDVAAVIAAAAEGGLNCIADVVAFLGLLNAEISVAELVEALSAVATVLGAQESQMAQLAGAASDNSNFPNGHWPSAISKNWIS